MLAAEPGECAALGVVLDAFGDHAIVLYESANFDPAAFPDPYRFDIRRAPNDHVAFGSGPHFCLGASLARIEVQVLLDRILTRLPDLELATSEPLPTFLGAITEMPVRFTPSARVAPA